MSAKTINLPAMVLDFHREWRLHVKVSIFMATGMTLEKAVLENHKQDIQERIRWRLPRLSFSECEEALEKESFLSPEETTKMIAEIRYDEETGADLLDKSYLKEYSEVFSIQIPTEIVEDVKHGRFEPEKWRLLVKELGIACKESYFQMKWVFDTKNRSVLTFTLDISRHADDGIFVSIRAEEENRLDDRMYDPVSEDVKFRPVNGKPFRVSYLSEWDDYDWEIEIDQGSLEILDMSIPRAGRWEDTFFARIFF